MLEFVVNPLLLEVARAVDRDICLTRNDLTSIERKSRMAAILHALKKIGMADSFEHQFKHVWNPTQTSVSLMELSDFNAEADQFACAVFSEFAFLLKVPADFASGRQPLVEEMSTELDIDVVRRYWRFVGTMAGGLAEGKIRFVGPVSEGGLFFETLDLTHQKTLQNFSLCSQVA